MNKRGTESEEEGYACLTVKSWVIIASLTSLNKSMPKYTERSYTLVFLTLFGSLLLAWLTARPDWLRWKAATRSLDPACVTRFKAGAEKENVPTAEVVCYIKFGPKQKKK